MENTQPPKAVIGCALLVGFTMPSPMFYVPPMKHTLKEELDLAHAQTSLLHAEPYLMAAAVAIPRDLLGTGLRLKRPHN